MAVNQSRQAVAAKIHGRYGRFFTPADYASLAASPGRNELLSALKNHPDFAQSIPTRERGGQTSAHQIFHWHLYEDLASLFRFDSFLGSPMITMVTGQLTVELVLSFVRHCNAGTLHTFRPAIPAFFRNHLAFDFQQLFLIQNYHQLIALFTGHPFMKILAANIPAPGQPVNLTDLEFDLMEEYYREMFLLFQSAPKEYEGTKAIFSMMVDADNLQKLLRTKRYYPDQKDAPRFFDGGFISHGQWKEWSTLTYQEITKRLTATRYGKHLSPDLPPDLALRRMLYRQCKANMRTKTGASDLLTSYFMLSRNRRECLTTIYQGVAYGMTPDAILALLPIC